MSTLTIPRPPSPVPVPPPDKLESYQPPPRRSPLVIFTDDQPFWQKLLTAASEVARRLIRKRATEDTRRTLRRLKPAAVLLDLDFPGNAAWDTADLLLQDVTSPPLLLLTSRTEQTDFKTAIQAGSLIDKGEDPAKVLQLVELTENSGAIHRERNAMQQLVIRWLKPCVSSSPQVTPMRRFWGINE